MSYTIVMPTKVNSEDTHLFLIDNDTGKPMEFETKQDAEKVRKDFGPSYKIADMSADSD